MKALRRLALVLAAALCACSPGQNDSGAPAQGELTTQRLATVRFATDWRAQAEQGGFYQAVATGEYRKRGLDVRIVQGGPGVNVPQLLAAGAVEMGMGSNSFIVMNLAQEQVPVKAVAAFFQKDPQVLIAHPDPALKSLADLKGRPILLADASVTAFWVWLKAKYGFSDDQVRKYNFNPAPFLADPRVVQQGYVTSEPYTIQKQAGFAPRVFLLADEGYPGYANMVLAPERLVGSNPAMVKAFVEASAQGWRDYLYGDHTAGDALILKDNPEMTQDLLDQAREKMKRYGLVDSGDAAAYGLGTMSDARWKQFFDMASTQGVYPKALDYKRAYTLQFVPHPREP